MSTPFSTKITELRHECGISQKEAAIDLGVSQALLSHYEKGIRECGLDFVVRVAKYYQVTSDYLLGIDDSEQKYNGAFVWADLPRDAVLSFNTIFRAVIFSKEYLDAADSEEVSERMKWLFTLTVYKALLMAADFGVIPKEWIRAKSKATNLISVSVIDAVVNDILGVSGNYNGYPSKEDIEMSENIKMPTSIKTIIEETDKYIFNIAKEFYE